MPTILLDDIKLPRSEDYDSRLSCLLVRSLANAAMCHAESVITRIRNLLPVPTHKAFAKRRAEIM